MIKIRNFSIVAHIDHGKSTLADRFIEICKKVNKNKIKNQMLDSMDLEREKGITIKSQCLSLKYRYLNNTYLLNLIDTPGHTDFYYEMYKFLSVCDGIILLIDATQGIQAQTVTNCEIALKKKLKIIPVINKIDIKKNCLEILKKDILELTKITNKNEIIEISAKTGYGVTKLIETIIKKIPHPNLVSTSKLNALIIDSWFNNYKGIVCIVYIRSGLLRVGDKIKLSSTKKILKIYELGIFIPEKKYKNSLLCGEIGFVVTRCKEIGVIKVGDELVSEKNTYLEESTILKDYKPKVFSSLYPNNPNNFEIFEKSFNKLLLNDTSIFYEIQKSNTFGFGFRCGFLGMLHLEITKERMKREYRIDIITTFPNIPLKIIDKNKKEFYITSPSELNNIALIDKIYEPIALVKISSKKQYINDIIELCNTIRGIKKSIVHKNNNTLIIYLIPMLELINGFFSKIQTITKGFVSSDYNIINYREGNLTKINILINKKKISELETIVHKNDIYKKV